MAYRIVIPPLTSESMNIIKNSSVAFAVSVAELTMFAMQAQEETSRGIEIYLAVTGLYFVSAFAVNRLGALVDRRVQVPGLLCAMCERVDGPPPRLRLAVLVGRPELHAHVAGRR